MFLRTNKLKDQWGFSTIQHANDMLPGSPFQCVYNPLVMTIVKIPQYSFIAGDNGWPRRSAQSEPNILINAESVFGGVSGTFSFVLFEYLLSDAPVFRVQFTLAPKNVLHFRIDIIMLSQSVPYSALSLHSKTIISRELLFPPTT